MTPVARLLAPRFLITVVVIVAAAILLALGSISASEWLTTTLGAGGVYSFNGAQADKKEAER